MPKSKRELGWDNDKERQRLWIHVGSWDYKVFFESPAWHRSYFFFEGAVSKGSYESSLIGLKVAGEIEIHLEALLPDEEEPPPDDLGSFNIVNEGPNPFLGVDLLVAPEGFAELFRVFSTAFGNNGGLGLNIHLKHPNGGEPDFWRSGWQKEVIQVAWFGFYCGGNLVKPKGLASLIS